AFRTGACYVPDTLAWFRVTENSYSNAGVRSEQQSEVLLEVLSLVLSPEFRDILPHFQVSGVLGVFGPSIIRAASRVSEKYGAEMYRLANCLAEGQYLELLEDPDSATRELAELFAGPAWRQETTRQREHLRIKFELAVHEHEQLTRERDELSRKKD